MSSVSRSVGRPVTRSVLAGQLNNLTQLIKSLFSLGEQGFAYDPNDLTTMWQDAAKLLPVTGEGQPVWHILDKSGNNNHAFATSSATRPILQRNATTGAYYLAFDGADDFLQTNSIDFTSTDKVSLFTGVRKLRDAATSVVCELSTNADLFAKSFVLFAPSGNGANHYDFRSFGTLAGVGGGAFTTSYPAPNSAVLTAKGSISSDICTLNINSTVKVEGAVDQGEGNYGNYPLYIGRRAGTTLPFNGHLYGLIGIGRLTSASETLALEKAIAKLTGVTLNV